MSSEEPSEEKFIKFMETIVLPSINTHMESVEKELKDRLERTRVQICQDVRRQYREFFKVDIDCDAVSTNSSLGQNHNPIRVTNKTLNIKDSPIVLESKNCRGTLGSEVALCGIDATTSQVKTPMCALVKQSFGVKSDASSSTIDKSVGSPVTISKSVEDVFPDEAMSPTSPITKEEVRKFDTYLSEKVIKRCFAKENEEWFADTIQGFVIDMAVKAVTLSKEMLRMNAKENKEKKFDHTQSLKRMKTVHLPKRRRKKQSHSLMKTAQENLIQRGSQQTRPKTKIIDMKRRGEFTSVLQVLEECGLQRYEKEILNEFKNGKGESENLRFLKLIVNSPRVENPLVSIFGESKDDEQRFLGYAKDNLDRFPE